MQGAVGTVRLVFDWSQIEPRRGAWEFSTLDAEVRAAARHGIAVMPVLYGMPPWLAAEHAQGPQGRRQLGLWTDFVRRVVHRYRKPIHRWQVWNEPNFPPFWAPRPEPHAYARLLGATARAIRGVDRRATVVAAGLAPVEGGMRPVDFLRGMYGASGARASFDVAALHPYSFTLAQLAFQVRRLRAVMRAAGDGGKPLQITELGIASASPYQTPFAQGRRGQARYLRRAFGLLLAQRRRWRIAGVEWFSWEDGRADPTCPFCQYAGLFTRSGRAKPAWRAYRRLVAAAQPARGGRVGLMR